MASRLKATKEVTVPLCYRDGFCQVVRTLGDSLAATFTPTTVLYLLKYEMSQQEEVAFCTNKKQKKGCSGLLTSRVLWETCSVARSGRLWCRTVDLKTVASSVLYSEQRYPVVHWPRNGPHSSDLQLWMNQQRAVIVEMKARQGDLLNNDLMICLPCALWAFSFFCAFFLQVVNQSFCRPLTCKYSFKKS